MLDYVPLNLPSPVVWATPFFGFLVITEMLYSKFGKSKTANYEAKDSFASLMMGVGNQIIGFATASLFFAITVFSYKHRMFEIGTGPIVFIVCFFLEDLSFYWFHRISHESRYFWASHIIHHSSQHYNLSTALRQTWTGTLSGGFIFWLPLAFLGFHPAMIGFFSGLSLVYQFWIHTEAIDKMPKWFEAIFNTPSHHRVHHAVNPDYLDANYSGVLIIWDKLFGTYVDENKNNKPKYGVVTNIATFNSFRIAFHEWFGIFKDIANANPNHIIGYIFGPPGWSPDGSRKTSKIIKQERIDNKTQT